jgi:hypothetical protein
VNEREEGFIKDIEINDLKNRYVLTKGSTQKQVSRVSSTDVTANCRFQADVFDQISEETGASVQTKGVWVPDSSKRKPGEEPLYIHIVGKTQEILDRAVEKVQDLINQELGPLIDERTLVARNRALGLPPPAGAAPPGRVKWPEDKLFIGLESMRNFNVRAKTVGPGVSIGARLCVEFQC